MVIASTTQQENYPLHTIYDVRENAIAGKDFILV